MSRIKLILIVVLPTLLIIGGVLTFYVSSELKTGRQEVNDHLQNDARIFGEGLATNSDRYVKQTSVLAALMSMPGGMQMRPLLEKTFQEHPNMTAIVIAFDPDFLASVRDGKHSTFALANYFPGIDGKDVPREYSFVCHTNRGEIVAGAAKEIDDYTSRDWFIGPKYTREAKWTNPFISGYSRSRVCAYSLPFRYDGMFAGVVSCLVPVKELANISREDDLVLKGADYLLVNPLGQVIYHSQKEATPYFSVYSAMAEAKHEPAFKNLDLLIDRDYGQMRLGFANPTVSRGETKNGHDNVLFVYSRIRGNNDWRIVASISEQVVFRDLYRRLTSFCVIALVAVLFICGLVSTMLIHATEPVVEMSRVAKAVAGGDFQTKIPESVTQRADELGAFSRTFNGMIDSLNANISTKVFDADVKARVEQEVDVAQELQEAFLPPDGFYFYPDMSFALQAKLVGISPLIAGDFYDYWFMTDNVVAFLIADVAGQGIPSVVSMVSARTLLRQLSDKNMSPGEVLTSVNRILIEEHKNGFFISALLAYYNPETGVLSYCNAGQVSPIVLKGDGAVVAFPYAENLVLGAIPDMVFESKEYKLEHGDALLLYTNGLLSVESETGEQFSRGHFLETLEKEAGTPTDRIISDVELELSNWRGESSMNDDAAVLLIKRTKPLPPVSALPWTCDEMIQSAYGNGDFIVNEVLSQMEKRNWSDRDNFAVNMAIIEGLNNAIEHGNALDDTKHVFVRCSVSDVHVQIAIRDEGTGFREDRVPDPRLRKRLTKPTGRGVFLIRNFMSKVSFNEAGNEVYMDKYRSEYI